MASGKKKKKAYKRKILINLSLLIVIFGIVAGIALKSSYFLVTNVVIKNNKVVTKEEIKILSKLEGKNIFLLDKESTIKNIKQNPYIENVEVQRSIPSKVTLDIKEKKIGAVIKLDEGYVNVDDNGKMVQIVSKFPEDKIPMLVNVPVKKYIPSGEVYEKEEQKSALKACLKVLTLDEVNSVFSSLDVSDPHNITLTTSEGVRVNIGSQDNIEYKLGYAISILNKEEVKNQKGYIKVLDDGIATFKKD